MKRHLNIPGFTAEQLELIRAAAEKAIPHNSRPMSQWAREVLTDAAAKVLKGK